MLVLPAPGAVAWIDGFLSTGADMKAARFFSRRRSIICGRVKDGPRCRRLRRGPNTSPLERIMLVLYPEIKPYARHELAVDEPHVLYAVES
ncbi:hypothetical protein JTM07_36180, partial [Pseudomonas aeruginosa]|nr:hypothetical protein [Pseudomonas aeruginosa]